MQLVLNTPGLMLKVHGGSFQVTAGEEVRLISPKQLSSIAITSACLISSAAIELAVSYGLSIYLFDEIGDAVGCLRSPYFESLATLRRKQVYFDDSPEAVVWVKSLFEEKTAEQVSALKYLADRKEGAAEPIEQAIENIQRAIGDLGKIDGKLDEISRQLMGWEGNQSRMYWKAVSEGLPDAWKFPKRSRRPAEDGFNAVVNYLYGMLYTLVEQAIFAAGLDPHLGILHADEYDAPTLAFDLIEPFRPWVDRLIIEQCITHKVDPGYFEQRRNGWFLNAMGKRFFIPLFNNWLEEKVRFRNKQMSRRLHIYRAAGELAARINQFEKDVPDQL